MSDPAENIHGEKEEKEEKKVGKMGIDVIEAEIAKVIAKVFEEVKKDIDKIEKFRVKLYWQNWLDNYNGKPRYEKTVYGIKIENSDLLDIITRMLRIVHDNDNIVVDYIVITNDNCYVQWRSDIYNDYGNYVGTEYRYEELSKIIKKLKDISTKMPNTSELIAKLKAIVNELI